MTGHFPTGFIAAHRSCEGPATVWVACGGGGAQPSLEQPPTPDPIHVLAAAVHAKEGACGGGELYWWRIRVHANSQWPTENRNPHRA
eukprot:CAMPEP_0204319586 /NCGR_PEP_ID=MMETSP0469-20131031/7182_1 /ASSEMBLY_ACC=CAM_ASM_000384 /TAXON_ID=2969 /ORGANISM="Oxyrrhis marina" /LENGTH=86 /DNA_ID=CAMNT_0051300777 /DNA_START=75 /DNA_END=333 /DNA_ORIENTATION=+